MKIFLYLLCFLLLGCGRKEEEVTGNNSNAIIINPITENADNGKLTENIEEAQAERSVVKYTQSIYQNGFNNKLLPEDFKIGELPEYDEPYIMIIESFCDALISGKYNENFVSRRNDDFIKRTIEPVLTGEIRIENYRIGKSRRMNNEEYFFPVRFFTKSGSAEGEIYIMKNETWLISDVQINFYEIPENSNRRYEPNNYRIENYY